MLEEFICEGIHLKEGNYEGKSYKKYYIYGMVPEMCNIFGNPHEVFAVPYNNGDIIFHGKKPEEFKGHRFHVSYNKYKQPENFTWDF